MFSIRKIVFLVFLISIVIPSASCSKSSKTIKTDANINKYIQYSGTIILEDKDSSISLYSTDKDKLVEIDNSDNILETQYNKNQSVYSCVIADKDNIGKNFISVTTKKRNSILNDFYYAKDLKISEKANYLAYRTFKTQSIDSAEGLKIYNIENNKQVNFKSNVLLSGNVYNWINDKEIAYYGISQGNVREIGIFKYNVYTDKEQIYIKDIPGYCMYFIPMVNSTLIFSKTESDNVLSIHSKDKNDNIVIPNNIENIYSHSYDKVNNNIYFIASDRYTKAAGIYKLNLDTYTLSKLNYDFPKVVDKDGGIHVDENGLIYYCGYGDLENSNNDVFIYNSTDESNAIITVKSSKYKVFGE